jgi:hypothetical protein
MPATPLEAHASPAVPHTATLTPAVPRAASEPPAAPHAAVVPPMATDGPPPRQWSSSPIISAKRPRQPAPSVPTGPALTPPNRRPPTAVPVTPPVNPHRMVTRAKAGFRVLPDRLVLTSLTSPLTPSLIPSSVRAVLADRN